jgi:ribosomal protein S14
MFLWDSRRESVTRTQLLWDTYIPTTDRLVSTPASFSGSPGIKSWSGDRLSWLKFVFTSVPPDKCWDCSSKLGQDHFLSHPFQLIICVSILYFLLYSLSQKASLRKLQRNRRASQQYGECLTCGIRRSTDSQLNFFLLSQNFLCSPWSLILASVYS